MNGSNKRSILIFVLLLMIISGVLSGHCFNGTNCFDLQYYAPYSENITSHVKDNLIPLCSSQMLQFAIIYVSAFSVFAYPVSCAVIFHRAFVIGACVSAMINSANYSQQTLCYLISYTLITVITAVLAVQIYDIRNDPQKSRTFKNTLSFACRCTVIFLMTSGASLLIRLVPLIILR